MEKTIRYCSFCGAEFDEAVPTSTCAKCLQPIPGRKIFEYKSKLELFGWPLIHVVQGPDPVTRRPRVARGFIAIGDIAIGGVAIGGLAIGGMAMGGAAIGLLTFAGMSMGLLLAIGGCSIGAGLSLGGMAIGSIAAGGMAVGFFSLGGAAFGMHAFGGNFRDPIALEFFQSWKTQIQLLVTQVGPIVAIGVLVPLLSIPFLRRTTEDLGQDGLKSGKPNLKDPTSSKRSFVGLIICLILGGSFGVGLLWLVMLGILYF